jgi:hypothetical protein
MLVIVTAKVYFMLHSDSFTYKYGSNVTVHRVCIHSDNNTVEISCLGMDCVDSPDNGVYDSIDKLPDWIQDRLAVLFLCDPNPPTKEVGGIGRRIDANVFWINK